MMKRLSSVILLLTLVLVYANCSKDGSDSPAMEENLVVALDPDPGGTVVRALGTSYDFKVVIQSKMPSQGVDVTVAYRKDSDNSLVFSQTLQSSVSPVSITVNNIPLNEVGTVTVDVKSKTKATNTASKSFKLVRK